jgi:hypothetical protein
METKKMKEIGRKIRALHKEMSKVGTVMRGTVVVIGTRNKQPYFSLNKDKRTRLIYLGRRREGLAREYSENYRRLLNIVEEMTILNMEFLKEI